MDFKNLKFVKKLQDFNPKLVSAFRSHMRDLKIKSRYIDYLIPDSENSAVNDSKRIEDMVRETLINEFSEKITEKKSYELLVDAVVHNIKKKQLGKFDEE